MQIGKPIKAMLAQKVSTIKEGFEALGSPFALEYKYDGFRLIIHKKIQKLNSLHEVLKTLQNNFLKLLSI